MKVNHSLVFFIGHYLSILTKTSNFEFNDATTEVRFTNNGYVWRHLLLDKWDNTMSGPRQSHINFIQLVIDEVHFVKRKRGFIDSDPYIPVRDLCLKLEEDLRQIINTRLINEEKIDGVEINDLLTQWLKDMAAI